MKSKIILLFLALSPIFSFSQMNPGSCAAFYANDTAFWIAADSKVMHDSGFTTIEPKILCYKGTYSVVTGLSIYKQSFSGYNIIKAVCDSVSSFKDQVFLLRKLFIKRLQDAMPGYSLEPSDTSPNITQLLFVKFEKGIIRGSTDAFKHGKQFKVVDSTGWNGQEITTQVTAVMGHDSANKVSNTIFKEDGTSNIQNRISKIQSDPNFHVDGFANFPLADISHLLFYIVYVDIKKVPNLVGYPITLLMVTKDGPTWILNQINTKCD